MVSKLLRNYLPQLEVEAVLKCNSLNIILLGDEVTIENDPQVLNFLNFSREVWKKWALAIAE